MDPQLLEDLSIYRDEDTLEIRAQDTRLWKNIGKNNAGELIIHVPDNLEGISTSLGTGKMCLRDRFARKAQEKRMPWPKLEEVQRDAMIEESVEESIKDYGNTVLYSTARNEYMIVRIKQLIRRSVWALTRQMEKGDFEPVSYTHLDVYKRQIIFSSPYFWQ